MDEIKKYVLVDIDNTILSQNKRKQAIVELLFQVKLSVNEINSDYSMMTLLQKVADKIGVDVGTVKSNFDKVFFGDTYYAPEYMEVIKGADDYLRKMSDRVSVIYLTSRSEKLRKVTEQNLKDFGFPEGEIIMRSDEVEESITTCEDIQRYAKTSAIKELLITKDVLFGVGDTAADCLSYYENGVQAILITTHETEQNVEKRLIAYCNGIADYDEFGLIGLNTWEEIYGFTRFVLGENDELQTVADLQTQDYTSFLGDLDNKSSMILLIATFCATELFSAIISKFYGNSIPLMIIALIGLLFSLLSVFFAINSFASKIVHTNGRMIKVIFGALFKRKTTFEPMKEKEVIDRSKFAHTATIKFLQKRYRSLNVRTIKNKTLYSVRAANYEKIYPEFKARVCLLIAIFCMLLTAIVFAVLSGCPIVTTGGNV